MRNTFGWEKPGISRKKNANRYLGRRPSLAKAGDPESDSFKVFFVWLLVHKSQCLHVYIYNIIHIYNIYLYILYIYCIYYILVKYFIYNSNIYT